MEIIWQYIFFEELRVVPEDCGGVFLMEPFNLTKANREKATQVMFENLEVSKFQIATQAEMSLSGSGLTTGLVVESGDAVSLSVPIFYGYQMPHAVAKIELAG